MATGRVPGTGAIVRNARTSQGLTLAELGKRVGYSAAQVSRYERGIAPLTDIAVLRRFAAALAIPPQVFGLAPEPQAPQPRHANPFPMTAGSPRMPCSTVADLLTLARRTVRTQCGDVSSWPAWP